MGPHKKRRKQSESSSSDSSEDKSKKKHSEKKKKKLKPKHVSSSSSESSSSSTDSEEERRRLEKKKLKKAKKKSKSKKKPEESNDIPLELMEKSRAMAPMTKQEWDKQQSVIRRVYDETTGRHRLIKGDGEVIEEIVSRDRHKAINQQATTGDGNYFQTQTLKK